MSVPAFSSGDTVAPYQGYSGSVSLFLASGGVAVPLAYKLTPGTVRATARLLQVCEPQAVVVVEWAAKRTRAKPEPPRIITLGSFILGAAAANLLGVTRDALLNDILEASGYFVLYTADRPENLILPAVWFPWDGRYGTTQGVAPQYLYTPQELGFGEYLPGGGGSSSGGAAAVIGNPPASSSGTGNKLYL